MASFTKMWKKTQSISHYLEVKANESVLNITLEITLFSPTRKNLTGKWLYENIK